MDGQSIGLTAKKARAEFLRILKPEGWLAILQTPCLDQELDEAIKQIRKNENGWDVEGDKAKLKKTPLSFFFGGDDFITLIFPETISETWQEFFGRQCSVSSAPVEDTSTVSELQKSGPGDLPKIQCERMSISRNCYRITRGPGNTRLRFMVEPSMKQYPFSKAEIERSIPERFERIVEQYPWRTAIRSERGSINYSELNSLANRIAHVILAENGASQAPITLLFGHEPDIIPALLGVLKSGNPYAALDPDIPAARNSFIIEDLQTRSDYHKYRPSIPGGGSCQEKPSRC